MARETERKFLVLGEAWRDGVEGASRIVQFYLFAEPGRSLRVRVRDGRSAVMTLKFGDDPRDRHEYEYPIPLAHAEALGAHSVGRVLEKTRHLVAWHGHIFEVDEFAGPLAGLVVAELEGAGELGAPPPWLGREVTDDPRYLNAELALSPQGAAGMSFIIEPSGRLDEAIRRAAHVELTRAVANLTLPPERLHEGVHEARKSFKRLRALYRLLEAAGPQAAANEVARFRAAAATLAAARDAAALVEAFERLEAAFPVEAADGALAPVKDFLLHRRDAATRAESGVAGHVASAIAACRAAYVAMDAFPLPGRRADAERLLAKGMAATLRRAGRALKAARRDGQPEAFHTLRKRVKDHLYHLGLLRHVWPKPGSLRRAAFDDLGERLGDLNDCDTLVSTLVCEAPALAESEAGDLALELLDRQAGLLRRHVLAEAGRLLAARPGRARRKLARRLRKARRER